MNKYEKIQKNPKKNAVFDRLLEKVQNLTVCIFGKLMGGLANLKTGECFLENEEKTKEK